MVYINDKDNASQISKVDAIGNLRVALKDAVGNAIGKKQREALLSTSEGVPMMGKNDDVATFIRTDRKGNQLMGNYIPLIIENFEGATVNVQKWTASNTTFVSAQTTVGGYVFNNTNLTTASAIAILTTQRLFYKYPRMPLQFKQRVRANIFTNSVADFGFGVATTTTLITPNGCSVRIINGLWSVAMTYNGSEIATENIVGVDGVTQLNTANSNAEFYVVDGIVDDDNFLVTVQNTQTGVIIGTANLEVPFSALKMWGATALPFYNRVYNTGSVPSTAPNLTVSELQILAMDMRQTPDDSQLAGRLGLSAGRNPATGAQTENHINSNAPTITAISNTAAHITTLGGKFQFAAVAGSNVDYCILGFQIPAGYTFLCEGVVISTRTIGVAVATTPTTLEWAAGFNSSAVSLATANIVRKQLGSQSFAVGAPVETVAPLIDINFITPEVVESGRFLHVMCQIPVGTATASHSIRGQIMIKGRFI